MYSNELRIFEIGIKCVSWSAFLEDPHVRSSGFEIPRLGSSPDAVVESSQLILGGLTHVLQRFLDFGLFAFGVICFLDLVSYGRDCCTHDGKCFTVADEEVGFL